MRSKCIAVVMSVATLCFATGDEPLEAPKTPDARRALTELQQSKETARQEYQRAVQRAEDEAARKLNDIKQGVMQRGDLDEANRIAAAVSGILSDSRAPRTRKDLRELLEGTTWQWGGGSERITFRKDATVGQAVWQAQGLVTEWEAVDSHTVVFRITRGRKIDLYAILCFDDAATSYQGFGFERGQPLGRSRPIK